MYVIVDPGPGHRVVITTGWDSHHNQVPTHNSLLQQLPVKNILREWWVQNQNHLLRETIDPIAEENEC